MGLGACVKGRKRKKELASFQPFFSFFLLLNNWRRLFSFLVHSRAFLFLTLLRGGCDTVFYCFSCVVEEMQAVFEIFGSRMEVDE